MAVDFDGDRLLVALDTTTLEYDLVDDIYREWKLWAKTIGNRRYPKAFRKVGGDPVGVGQTAPDFVFLNNEAGWRVKKPEADIEVEIFGNLVRQDTTRKLFVPPDGAFRPAVLVNLSNVSNNDLAAFAMAMWGRAVEGQFTAEECLRLILAAAAGAGGKVSDTLFEYFDPTGAHKRLSVTTDGAGDRTAVDATP